jgi:chondroitin synthase
VRLSAAELPLPRMTGCHNDYSFIEEKLALAGIDSSIDGYRPSRSVSIVIPVFNRASLLRLGLTSIKRQDLPASSVEVIVVDDGSGPEVKQVCDESELANLRYVRREPDPGFTECAARNAGIHAARNEIIIQLDPEIVFASNCALRWILRWFETGVELAVTVPRLYVGSKSVTVDDVAGGNVPICVTGESDGRESLYAEPTLFKHRYMPFMEMLGFCMAYTRAAAFAVGGWADDWSEYGGSDQEFAYRLYQYGVYCIYERNAPALHLHHPTAPRSGSYRKFLADRVPPYRAHRYPGPALSRARVPRVSIYVPAYNVGPYIGEALESARNQTLEDIEICVCDDGSEDYTAEVIAEHAQKDARVRWVQTPHRGCAAASAAAVQIARGEFLLQLDADDVLHPEAAEALLLELDRRPWVGLAFANLVRTDERLQPISPAQVFKRYRRFQTLMCMHVTAPRMWRRRLHSLVGGWCSDLSSAIDYDLFLRMAERTPFFHLDRVLYYYRYREGSLSREREQQFANAKVAVENSLRRMGLAENYRVVSVPVNSGRWYEFEKIKEGKGGFGFVTRRGAAVGTGAASDG